MRHSYLASRRSIAADSTLRVVVGQVQETASALQTRCIEITNGFDYAECGANTAKVSDDYSSGASFNLPSRPF
jgi:hypothetical protein